MNYLEFTRSERCYMFFSSKIYFPKLLVIFFIAIFSLNTQANISPVLNFSDLISGPDAGLGDGKGSGVIVTVWGQNLGASQGNSSILFIDSNGVSREAAHVYYWKNADGQLPGGPSNLFESHKMQEIAFSIPKSINGAGSIVVTVNGQQSNPLPFTVRPGNIYHVKPNGNDSLGSGSFDNPWMTVAKADSIATAGDTLYVHNVITQGDENNKGRVYYNNKGFKADTSNQFAYVAYPNTRPELYGRIGIAMYLTTGIVSSKLSVFASNCTDDTLTDCIGGSLGIMPSDWGRVIGNKITDIPGMCATGQAGAISGGIDTVEGSKIFGNFIHDYACPNTSKLHHTTYMTIRDRNDKSIEAWEIGWNYLKDNHAKNGIHNYDEDNSSTDSCGDLKSDLHIHNNVIINQGGAGINIASACGWSQDTYIYNNVVINAGIKTDVDCTFNCGQNVAGIHVLDEGLLGTVKIYNNTVHTWESAVIDGDNGACLKVSGRKTFVTVFFNNNICYTPFDRLFVSLDGQGKHSDKTFGNNNIWFYPGQNPKLAILPVFDESPLLINNVDFISKEGSQIRFNLNDLSELKALNVTRDIYGIPRTLSSNVGAVAFLGDAIKILAKPPSNFSGVPVNSSN